MRVVCLSFGRLVRDGGIAVGAALRGMPHNQFGLGVLIVAPDIPRLPVAA